MKILSIDQSYTSAGIVVIEDGMMTHCEKYSTDKENDIFQRAWELTTHIRSQVAFHKPDLVALEGLAFASNGNATRDLAGLLFTIVNVLTNIDQIEVKIYPATTVKKIATGKGNAKKEVLIEVLPKYVRDKFDELGVKKTTGLGDLSDAYWIGICAEKDNESNS